MTTTTTPGDATADATTAEQPTNHAMTPGPWAVRMNDMVYAGSRMVADCETTPIKDRPRPPEAEAKANARAIAAVPAMVEAVRKAAQYTKHPINSSDMRYAVQELCRAALKSAGVVV